MRDAKNGHGSVDNGSLQADCFLYLHVFFQHDVILHRSMTGHVIVTV